MLLNNLLTIISFCLQKSFFYGHEIEKNDIVKNKINLLINDFKK